MPVRIDSGPTAPLAITPSATPAAAGGSKFGLTAAQPGAVSAGASNVASGTGGTGMTLAQMKALAAGNGTPAPAGTAPAADSKAAETVKQNIEQFFGSFEFGIATKSIDGTGLDKE